MDYWGGGGKGYVAPPLSNYWGGGGGWPPPPGPPLPTPMNSKIKGIIVSNGIEIISVFVDRESRGSPSNVQH